MVLYHAATSYPCVKLWLLRMVKVPIWTRIWLTPSRIRAIPGPSLPPGGEGFGPRGPRQRAEFHIALWSIVAWAFFKYPAPTTADFVTFVPNERVSSPLSQVSSSGSEANFFDVTTQL